MTNIDEQKVERNRMKVINGTRNRADLRRCGCKECLEALKRLKK